MVYCVWPRVIYADNVEGVIKHIREEYATIKEIKGRFSQRSLLKDLDSTEDYSGYFFIKKPSCARWEYSGSRDEVVVVNGDRFWIYKGSERQVLKGTFKEGSYSQLPVALLNGLDDLEKDFYLKATGEGIIELIPRHKMGAVKKIRLVTGTDGFPIKRFTIFDIYDNSVTITIEEAILNPGLDDSIFTLQIPSDVEVFDLDQ